MATRVNLDPSAVADPFADEDQRMSASGRDIKWDALRPQSQVPLAEAQAHAEQRNGGGSPAIRPATREDYDPPMDPPEGEQVIEDRPTEEEAEAAPAAPYGYKADGTPRKRPAPTPAMVARQTATRRKKAAKALEAKPAKAGKLRPGKPQPAFTPNPASSATDLVAQTHDALAEPETALTVQLETIKAAKEALEALLGR